MVFLWILISMICLTAYGQYKPEVYMQEIKDALPKGRKFATPYIAVSTKLKASKYLKRYYDMCDVAEKNGYVGVGRKLRSYDDDGLLFYFVPKSEYETYLGERMFAQKPIYRTGLEMGNMLIRWIDPATDKENVYYDGNNNFWFDVEKYAGRHTGKAFKSVGTAMIYEDGKFRTLEDIHWTGGCVNGKLDGEGVGYCVIEEFPDTVYRSIAGAFQNGFPLGDMFMAKTICRQQVYDNKRDIPFKQETLTYNVGKLDDGVTYYSVKDYCGFVNSEGKVLMRPRILKKDIKGEFSNGSIHIVRHGTDILVDKYGKFQRFADNATVITYGIVSSNPQIKTITIPPTVKTIENSAFSGCTNLQEIVLPQSVTKIGDHAFAGCISLTKAVIPAAIKWEDAPISFYGCNNLKAITQQDSNGKLRQDTEWLKKSDVEIARREKERKELQEWYAEQRRLWEERLASAAASGGGYYYDSSDEDESSSKDPDTLPIEDYEIEGTWERRGFLSGFSLSDGLAHEYLVVKYKDSFTGTRSFISKRSDSSYGYTANSSGKRYRTLEDAIKAEWIYMEYKLIRKTGLIDD